MSQQIETEYKNLLTKDEYDMLIVHFNLEEIEPIKQANVYYEHPDWLLRERGMGLRIRLYDDYAEQTLKSPIREHEMLETTDTLTLKEGQALADSGQLKTDGFVAQILKEHGIAINELKQVGQLSTVRYEIPVEEGTYFLDASYYQDQNDYELEYETSDPENGLRVFEQFLTSHNINRRETVQKIARALKYPNK